MKFVPIFDDEDCLLSVKEDDEEFSEFDKIFRNWTDIEYLDTFFSENATDLKRSFWEGISTEQAIIETRDEAIKFRRHLRALSKRKPSERLLLFVRLFKPLIKTQAIIPFLEKKKAYGLRNKTWLRIYALKFGSDKYIITGGAIKLTDNMSEREHTMNELRKLETCKRFIIDEGIVDEDGIIELLEL
jgi:hypothetical protein